MSMFQMLAESSKRFPARGAVYAGTELIHDYANLCDRALRLAAALRGHGRPGDRVAIVSENRPEYVEAMYGTWAAGMVLVPINAKLHAKEMIQILEDSEARVVLVSPKLSDALFEACAASNASCVVITVDSDQYRSMLGCLPLRAFAARPEDLAWLFYTSGTTGRSKGAMLSHRNLTAMTIGHLAEIESFDENASQIHAAPMSHGSGLYLPAYIARGARLVIPASGAFDPTEFLDLCDAHPSCGAFLAPTMVQRLRLDAERTQRRTVGLRSIVYGGAPMYLEEMKKSLATFGPVFAQIYGQGESPMTITALRQGEHQGATDEVLASVGSARLGVVVRVVTDDGQDCQCGEVGEIICRSDVVMSGYWRNSDATAQAIRDGWLYTGDMGSLDAAGRLTLRDRSKDVIISGGSNIYPREVEEVLLTHPAVSEVCVVGQHDEEWGEVVVAFIVPERGVAVAPCSLDTHCLEHIARFKRPKRYLIVDALPKSNYGKVLKRELRQQLMHAAPID